jgi:hypothetical protein
LAGRKSLPDEKDIGDKMATITYEVGILAETEGYYYTIFRDGRQWIYQSSKPAIGGLMNENEATALAQALVARLSAVRNPAEDAEKANLERKTRIKACPHCGWLVPLPSGAPGDFSLLTPTQLQRLNELSRKGGAFLTTDEVRAICEEANK